MQNETDISISNDVVENILNRIEDDEKTKIYKLINNYVMIVQSNLRNILHMLDCEKNMAIIVYNFSLLLELFLKMTILKLGFDDVPGIGKYEHNISNMFNTIFDNIVEPDIRNIYVFIKERASLIKQLTGDNVNYNSYADFRYNHKRGELELIFADVIGKNDIKYIMEAVECIKLLMCH